MGAIALLLQAKGHQVSGSDIKESEYTGKLREGGAEIFIGHDAKNISHPSVVVYSSAIHKDNPELIAAQKKNIPIVQRAQVLAQLMETEKGITIAGAHGKTTTTSMISYLLIKADIHPTTAVGGIVNGGAYNANLGDGRFFVAEVDESDGSFLYFAPFYSIITNIDFEHVDYYGTWDAILNAYRKFIEKTNPSGRLFVCGEDARLMTLVKESRRSCTRYGFEPTNDIYAINFMNQGYFSSFECVYKGKNIGTFHLKIPGKHNILNSLACIALGLELSIDLEIIRRSLEEFSGAKRRFQLKGDINDIMVVDDYGHHPTEIKATLEAAKSFGRKRVVVVFQPHRYTRTKFLMEEFVKSLSNSDYLILTDIYAASEDPIEGVSTQALYEKMKALNHPTVVYLKKDEILGHLSEIVRRGDLVLTLGAGDVTKISDDLAKQLREDFARLELNH